MKLLKKHPQEWLGLEGSQRSSNSKKEKSASGIVYFTKHFIKYVKILKILKILLQHAIFKFQESILIQTTLLH